MVDCRHAVAKVSRKCGVSFVAHDLRRTFVTTAARLDIPHYAIKKLANHVSGNDVTCGYIVVDVDRLREHMLRITSQLLMLLQCNVEELLQ